MDESVNNSLHQNWDSPRSINSKAGMSVEFGMPTKALCCHEVTSKALLPFFQSRILKDLQPNQGSLRVLGIISCKSGKGPYLQHEQSNQEVEDDLILVGRR